MDKQPIPPRRNQGGSNVGSPDIISKVVNQKTSASRVADTKDYGSHNEKDESLSARSPQVPKYGLILGQLFPLEIWRHILFFEHMQTFLDLRLVSKIFENLVWQMKILKEKAVLVVKVKDQQSWGKTPTHQYLESKFGSKENLDVRFHTILCVSDLEGLSSEFIEALKSIQLNIKNRPEVILLVHYIQNFQHQKIFERVRTLSFYYHYEDSKEVYIPGDITKRLLNLVENNIRGFFPNLRCLILTSYAEEEIVHYPRLVRQQTTLSLGSWNSNNNNSLNFENLQCLFLGRISLNKENDGLMIQLDNLISLQIDNLISESKYDFLKNIYYPLYSLNLILPNLKNLQISNTVKWQGWSINFSKSLLPNLGELRIGHMKENCSFEFSILQNLKHLIVSSFDTNSTLRCGELPNLEVLELGLMKKNITCILPSSLKNLISMELVGIDSSANFELPNELPSLRYLKLKNPDAVAISKIPKFLPKVNRLVFQCKFPEKETISFSTSFDSLEKLVIPGLGEGTKIIIDLSKFPKLTNLVFGDVGSSYNGGSIELMGSKNSISSLTFKNIHESSFISLPKALNKLSKLEIEDYHRSKINLPDSLPSLTELVLRKTNVQITSVDGEKQFERFEHYHFHDYKSSDYNVLIDDVNCRINLPPCPEDDISEICCLQ